MNEISRNLDASPEGDPRASEALLPEVYQELRRLAASRLAHERAGQTLQATALVHEAWLRLVGSDRGGSKPKWEGRRHFFGAAAEAMRRILVENARRKARLRRGGGSERVDLDEVEIASPLPDDDLLALHEALDNWQNWTFRRRS